MLEEASTTIISQIGHKDNSNYGDFHCSELLIISVHSTHTECMPFSSIRHVEMPKRRTGISSSCVRQLSSVRVYMHTFIFISCRLLESRRRILEHASTHISHDKTAVSVQT